jgi:DNA (cytosine-5)-methyltransferase 1
MKPKSHKSFKYSELREKLGIDKSKFSDEGCAFITQYLQNQTQNGIAEFYYNKAVPYLHSHSFSDLLLGDREVQYRLPIQWDVPFPPPSGNGKFTFVDLFAGIGGMRLAYQKLGGKCVFTSEWNTYSKKTYEANFGEVPFGDITKIHEADIPDHDLLLAGFPCQPFSIAGVSKKNALGRAHGFLDETQGTLFFDVARILGHKKPKAFMLENVKNLVSHDKGRTFKVILDTLGKLGYSVESKIMDSKHYVPQHRERIIIVGFRRDIFSEEGNSIFPKLSPAEYSIKHILERAPDSKYTLTPGLWKYLQDYAAKHKAQGNGFGYGLTDLNGISRTLSARYYKDGSEILIPQKDSIPRRLTPRECARLQGFPDNFIIDRVSDTQAYKQFGNAVTVPVIHAVGKTLIRKLLKGNGKYTQQHYSISAAV